MKKSLFRLQIAKAETAVIALQTTPVPYLRHSLQKYHQEISLVYQAFSYTRHAQKERGEEDIKIFFPSYT